MEEITLRYQDNLPAYENRTFEGGIGDWDDSGGDCAVAAETGTVRTGAGSLKLDMSGFGASHPLNANYAFLASAKYQSSGFVAGLDVSIECYAKAASGTPSFLMGIGASVAESTTALNASTWTKAVLSFTITAGHIGQDLRISVNAGVDVFVDDLRVIIEKDYEVLAVRGFDDPDEVEEHNFVENTSEDGTLYQNSDGLRRLPGIRFGTIMEKESRLFLSRFYQFKLYRAIVYGSEEMEVVPREPKFLSNKWLEDVVLERDFELKFAERNVWTTEPNSW